MWAIWTSRAQSGHWGHRISWSHAAHWMTHRIRHLTHHHSWSLSQKPTVHHSTIWRSTMHHIIRPHWNWPVRTHSHRSVGSHHYHMRISTRSARPACSSRSTRSSHTAIWTHHNRSVGSHHVASRSHHSRRSHSRRHHTTLKGRPVDVIWSHHSLSSVHGMVWWRSIILIIFPFLL